MNGEHAPRRLEVQVPGRPEPTVLRAAIEARLAGAPWAGPERAVGDAVAAAVAAAQPREARAQWR